MMAPTSNPASPTAGALHHIAIGPLQDGGYAAAYETPGCAVMTVVCPCKTQLQALEECDRLNAQQIQRELDLQRELALCGRYRITSRYEDLA